MTPTLRLRSFIRWCDRQSFTDDTLRFHALYCRTAAQSVLMNKNNRAALASVGPAALKAFAKLDEMKREIGENS